MSKDDKQGADIEALVAKLKALPELGIFTGQDSGYSRLFDQAPDIAAQPITTIDMDQLTPELKALVIGYFKDKHDRAQAVAKLMELIPYIKFDIEALERSAFPAGNA
jgi:hypothetical protein